MVKIRLPKSRVWKWTLVISGLLKNQPRQQVATQSDISGALDDPDSSILQIIVNLIRNAFFQAILPGFEQEVN